MSKDNLEQKQHLIDLMNMEKQTAVEWFYQRMFAKDITAVFEQAKEMEKQEKLINQLFIGKVVEVLGFDKTTELLKECKGAFKK
jgi:hemoglobin-like flavoprotein